MHLGLAVLLLVQTLALANEVRTDRIELLAGGQRLTAELAITATEQMRGLMGRTSLPADHGMLFVYARPGYRCMWMKDTLIPLSVAFLDASGTIINIARMEPLRLDEHCAHRPARFSLEMEADWFERHGLRPGMRIEGLEAAARAMREIP